MSITLSNNVLTVAGRFQIKPEDSVSTSAAKLTGGTTLKFTSMALAAFEYSLAKIESALPFKQTTSGLAKYTSEASDIFRKAVTSLNHPFAPTTRMTSSWCGLRKDSEVIEGPTVTSYVRKGISKAKQTAQKVKQTASNHKGKIAAAAIFTTAAIALYYFGPALFSKGALDQPQCFDYEAQCFDYEAQCFDYEAPTDNAVCIPKKTIQNDIKQWVNSKLIQATHYPLTGIISTLVTAGIAIKEPQRLQSYLPYIFGLNVVGSLAEALGIRASNITGTECPWGAQKCAGNIDFPLINRAKQLQVKIPGGAVLPPILISLVSSLLSGQSIRSQFSLSNLAFYLPLLGLSLTSSQYGESLGLTTDSFDSSGHAMIKLALSFLVASAVSNVARIPFVGAPAATAFAGTYLVTDSIFLKNTARLFHSGYEVIAGTAWGAGISGMSWLLAKIVPSVVNP